MSRILFISGRTISAATHQALTIHSPETVCRIWIMAWRAEKCWTVVLQGHEEGKIKSYFSLKTETLFK